jgi:deoxycytidine triphosphate deaminase
MLGTVVNNKQFISLEKAGTVRISPFDPARLKTIHYPLVAKDFFSCDGREAGEPKFKDRGNFRRDNEIEFLPNEYMVVEIKERIELQEGIIGHFVPSSTLIDYGFLITCGRIEHPYGKKGEVIRFGITNQLNNKNKLSKDETIAYVYFIDLRALSNLKIELSADEEILFRRWQKYHAYRQDSGNHDID